MNKNMLRRDQVTYRHEWRHAHLDLRRLPQKRFLSKADAREAAVMLMHKPTSPDEDLEQVELQRAVQEALASIPAKFAEALTLYFGLDGKEPCTFQQVAVLVGYKHGENARQRIAKAMRLMQHPIRTKKLRDYL